MLIVAYTSTVVKYFRYVELLDKYFGSVCELDIIFNFEKAYFVLDELLIAGEVQVPYRIVSVSLLIIYLVIVIVSVIRVAIERDLKFTANNVAAILL